jgi:sugar lactone lactonase YvrE
MPQTFDCPKCGAPVTSERCAVDGWGYIYALGIFNNAVFKFGRDGKFINRFSGAGDQPGQFRAPYSIAVDGRGRVYVGDMKGIQVFDADGRYLTILNLKGVAFGMVFNDKNELFVVARDHVIKYALPAQ